MDFLKTLLLYMTATFAIGVQAAPDVLPTAVPTQPPAVTQAVQSDGSETPMPGVLPTLDGVVTITATPTAAPVTPTPKPTERYTPMPHAEPTITPNPSYRNLKQGDRGENVRKLQERLIELGYLGGKPDGAYGAQTRRAVLRFQYYNGLQQDGVAGRMTQTILFESDDIMACPDEAVLTSTPVPAEGSESPAPPVPEEPEAPEDIEDIDGVEDIEEPGAEE